MPLLGWQGKCCGRASHLTSHGFLSELHHPHIFFASAAEFPGPGYKDIITCNLLWFRVDLNRCDGKQCASTAIHAHKVADTNEGLKIIIVL